VRTFFAVLVLTCFSWSLAAAQQVTAATIDRDCAPWDGAAFRVLMPLQGSALEIAIWQAPDLKRATTFSFPDPQGRRGVAFLRPPFGAVHELSGTVSFSRVEVGQPVEGELKLVAANGNKFEHRFKASWGKHMPLCG